MSNYDNWKLRAPEDDGPQDEPEPEQINEAEYALYDADQAYMALVEHWGEVKAQRLMFAIFLRRSVSDLKERHAAVLNSWRTT